MPKFVKSIFVCDFCNTRIDAPASGPALPPEWADVVITDANKGYPLLACRVCKIELLSKREVGEVSNE